MHPIWTFKKSLKFHVLGSLATQPGLSSKLQALSWLSPSYYVHGGLNKYIQINGKNLMKTSHMYLVAYLTAQGDLKGQSQDRNDRTPLWVMALKGGMSSLLLHFLIPLDLKENPPKVMRFSSQQQGRGNQFLIP